MVSRLIQYHRNLILLVVIIIILEYLCPDKLNLCHFSSHDSHTDHEYNGLRNSGPSQQNVFTSVWCRGQNHTNRLCRFQNLCFSPRIQQFLFFHHSDSVISGLSKDRFNPAVADFSSVEDHNTQYFNYIDLPATAIKNFNFTLLDGHALIFKRFNPENLMHVFHDDLLPAFSTLLELFDSLEAQNIYLVFADERELGPYNDIYSNFLNSKPIFLSNENLDDLLCFRNSYIGLNKHTTWYQYGFNKPQGKIEKDMMWISKVIKMFCHYFRKKFNIVPSEMEEKQVVLFDRMNNRKIVNKNEVITFVEQSTQLKVRMYSLETHNIMEIITAVSSCAILIGMHGALLVLSMFLPPGSIVIELFPYAIDSHVYTPYRTLATLSTMGLIYVAWENRFRSKSIPYPDNPPQFGGIRHLPPEEQESIMKSSRISPHLCCYNPEWLYHIYQDTIVDIPSFGQILQSALSMQRTFSFDHYHLKMAATVESSIHPGEIQNMSCITSGNQGYGELVLSWKPPWNLEFIKHDGVEYEIWLQLAGTEDVRAFVTKKTYFTQPKLSNDALYHIWIRCNVNGLSGPFTSNPLVCLS